MSKIAHLLENNRVWAESMLEKDPDFFERLAHGQAPKYLWIGCADSRVPANEILGLLPGEVFVHRNIANLMVHTDLNALSVLEYAVEILKVKHIIVCGHYGCGGIIAAMYPKHLGIVDNWLQHIIDVQTKYEESLQALGADEEKKYNFLCELNVYEQVINVCRTSVVQKAWEAKQSLTVHGLIYAVSDGLLHELWSPISNIEQIPPRYRLELEKK
jgi:carbonic anhydrase